MKKIHIAGLALASLAVIYAGCRKEEPLADENYSSAPNLPASAYDYTNSTNDDLATLGRVLFYDKKLSLNNTISCGSCHLQSKAFADGKQFSKGLQDKLTRRNSPSIVSSANSLFWDGRANSFYQLAGMPLVDHVEMKNYDLAMLEEKVRNTSYYPDLFTKAFGSSNVNMDRIQTAIAEFLVNFDFSNNKFRRVGMGMDTYSPIEEAGRDVFMNKGRCSSCHNGAVLDGWAGGECIGLDENYADNGIGERTQVASNNAQFKIPSLFNIEFTAPYMHDGRFNTLEEVVEHYNSGIKNHPNLSWALKSTVFDSLSFTQIMTQFDTNGDGNITLEEVPPGAPVKLGLTDYEKKALVAFLKTLSDPNIFSDVRFSDPFKQ